MNGIHPPVLGGTLSDSRGHHGVQGHHMPIPHVISTMTHVNQPMALPPHSVHNKGPLHPVGHPLTPPHCVTRDIAPPPRRKDSEVTHLSYYHPHLNSLDDVFVVMSAYLSYEGYYLLRNSFTKVGTYTVSVTHENSIKHFHIERTSCTYYLHGKHFNTIDALIKNYGSEDVPNVEGVRRVRLYWPIQYQLDPNPINYISQGHIVGQGQSIQGHLTQVNNMVQGHSMMQAQSVGHGNMIGQGQSIGQGHSTQDIRANNQANNQVFSVDNHNLTHSMTSEAARNDNRLNSLAAKNDIVDTGVVPSGNDPPLPAPRQHSRSESDTLRDSHRKKKLGPKSKSVDQTKHGNPIAKLISRTFKRKHKKKRPSADDLDESVEELESPDLGKHKVDHHLSLESFTDDENLRPENSRLENSRLENSRYENSKSNVERQFTEDESVFVNRPDFERQFTSDSQRSNFDRWALDSQRSNFARQTTTTSSQSSTFMLERQLTVHNQNHPGFSRQTTVDSRIVPESVQTPQYSIKSNFTEDSIDSRPPMPIPAGECLVRRDTLRRGEPYLGQRKRDPDYVYDQVRDVDQDCADILIQQLRLEGDSERCPCGLYIDESELPNGWTMHICKESPNQDRLFYLGPDGSATWQLPESIMLELTPDQQDKIKEHRQKYERKLKLQIPDRQLNNSTPNSSESNSECPETPTSLVQYSLTMPDTSASNITKNATSTHEVRKNASLTPESPHSATPSPVVVQETFQPFSMTSFISMGREPTQHSETASMYGDEHTEDMSSGGDDCVFHVNNQIDLGIV